MKNKFHAQRIAFGLMLFGLASAQAIATDIADVPLSIKNSAGPNIMFTLDDSGSMQFEVLPEEEMLISDGRYLFPTNSGLYGGSFYTCNGEATSCVMGYEDNNRYNFRNRSNRFNKAYYDPAVRYRPWSNADGSAMANASPACAPHNPANTGAGCRNLTVVNNGGAKSSTDSYGRFYRRHSDGSYAWSTGNYSNPQTGSIGFWPATHFVFNASNVNCTTTVANQPSDRDCFTKVEIRSTVASYAKAATRTDCTGATCTYAQEIQNFANWYTYYRSRVLASRAGIGRAFSLLSDEPRIGFAAINQGTKTVDGISSTGAVIDGVRRFTGTNRTAFFTRLYGHSIPTSGTPLRRALDDVGQYFSRSDNQGPWSAVPGSANSTPDAVCRQSYNILMTDGYWNGNSASTAGAKLNVDGTAQEAITGPGGQTFTYTPASPFSDTQADVLADVAMYYWVRDLRTDLDNKVKPNQTDPAFWQHMVTYTVGLGVNGSINPATCPPPYTAAGCATIVWPAAGSGSTSPNVDDLLHAAVNGRGQFFSASNPDEFANSMSEALNSIVGREGASAAVAVANAFITGGDNTTYRSSYNSGNWSGQLLAYPINVTTGAPDLNAPIWTTSPQARLDTRSASDRKIVSHSGAGTASPGIQFQPNSATTTTKLSTTQQTLLNTTVTPPGPSDGANVVAFLRGDRSLEGTDYRSRAHVLGDMVNAEPLVVRAPEKRYGDTCYSSPVAPTCTTSFAADKASRTRVIVQGANDGMVHIFNATDGVEEWAYVPNLLMASLNNLSRKIGFQHRYYVDGTPLSADVDLGNTSVLSGGNASRVSTNPDWRTIVVGGLGKGGRGFYALDVTNPVPTSEANAAAKVLWEFPNSATSSTIRANVGYSFGRPVIVKTDAHGWVVLVTSGYNNGADTGGDGHGYLWVLSAKTGEVLYTFDTTQGTSASPSGLAFVSAYVENNATNMTAEYVYGGDLLGNVWRFKVTGNSSTWNVKRLAALTNSSGTAQPVTSEPELTKIRTSAGVRRMVYVGTGRYLGDADLTDTSVQTMYGLVDDLSEPSGITAVISGRSELQEQALSSDASGKRTISGATIVDYATKMGWYLDLNISGERINTTPALILGALVFTSNIPSNDVCSPGGSSWITVVDAKSGNAMANSTLKAPSNKIGDVLASRPVVVQVTGGKGVGLVGVSSGGIENPDLGIPMPNTNPRRVSWRELITD